MHSEEEIRQANRNLLDAIDRVDNWGSNLIFPIFYEHVHNSPAMIGISLDKGLPFISFARSEDDSFNSKRRVRTKLRRYMGKFFRETHPGRFFEASIDLAGSAIIGANMGHVGSEILELSGYDVYDEYENDYVAEGSCMNTYPEPTELFAENPDKVSMIVAENPERGRYGRALVWNTDDGERVLDRCYPNHSEVSNFMRKWARDNGVWVRSDDSCPDGNQYWTKDGKDRCKFEVSLKPPSNEMFPYMDSFMWCNGLKDTVVSTYFRDGCKKLESTEGGPFNDIVECAVCGLSINGYDEGYFSYRGDIYCRDCFNLRYFRCRLCSRTYRLENANHIPGKGNLCEYCYNTYSQCSRCGGHYQNIRHVNMDGERVCSNCWMLVEHSRITVARHPQLQEAPAEIETSNGRVWGAWDALRQAGVVQDVPLRA
jgi:hypothetical protein